MIKKIAIFGILAVVLAFAGAYGYRNIIVEGAVEEGSGYALGVETDLGSASLDIAGGALELDNLEVENPDGFTSENFFSIDRFAINLNTGSVFDDEIVVDTFVLSGLALNLEQVDGASNYSQILNHIRTLDMGESSESETTMRINYLAIKDIAVSASVRALGKERFNKNYDVDGFVMTNLGDQSFTIAELSGIVFEKVIKEALKKGGSLGFDLNAEIDKAKTDVAEKAKSEVSNQLKKLGIGGK